MVKHVAKRIDLAIGRRATRIQGVVIIGAQGFEAGMLGVAEHLLDAVNLAVAVQVLHQEARGFAHPA